MRYMYPAIFTENELDGYSVQFVDFENGYTCGDDMEDAVAMAAEVLWLLIDDYLQLDKPLPKPTYPIEHEGLLVALSVDVDTERGVLTTKMAAHLLGVSDARVRQMICSGQLAAKKQGRDNYVYLSSVKERLNNPPKPAARARATASKASRKRLRSARARLQQSGRTFSRTDGEGGALAIDRRGSPPSLVRPTRAWRAPQRHCPRLPSSARAAVPPPAPPRISPP